MTITTHEINLHGTSGGIFWSITLAIIFYVLGFATNGWQHYGSTWVGLWATCSSSTSYYGNEDWFKATQGMITVGLVLLFLAALCIFLYMFVHDASISKTALLKVFVCFCFIAVISMLIGIIIFGAKVEKDLNWSYAFAIIGAIFCLIAGILGIVQMKQSNMI